MARLAVITEQLTDQAGRLSRVPAALNSAGELLHGATGAAQDTEAAQPHDRAVQVWSAVIAMYAISSSDLARALIGAAAAYHSADKLPGG